MLHLANGKNSAKRSTRLLFEPTFLHSNLQRNLISSPFDARTLEKKKTNDPENRLIQSFAFKIKFWFDVTE